MKKYLLPVIIFLIFTPVSYSQINVYPYIETGEFPVGWNVIQTTPIWNFGTSLMNPAGKTNDAGVVCNFFAYAAGPVGIVTSPLFNFTALTNPVVNFYTAYTSYDLQNDSLQFLVSTDNGVTFVNVPVPFRRSFNSSPSLATVPTQHTQYIPSAMNQWRHETINMTAYAGMNNIMFGLRGVCDYGNNLWIDNFIVNDADSIHLVNVNTAGTYSFGIIDVTFTSIGEVNFKNQNDNPGGGMMTFVEYRNQNPVPSVANPKIAVNAAAVCGDGSVFTPNKISPDKWFTISYSGNDIRGFSNYGISIDISSISGIYNPDKLYIVKRADMTGSWICLNTSRNGTRLNADNLTTFSDFAIASDSIINPLPVELISFHSEVNGGNVMLRWETQSEINNSGFEIERKHLNEEWIKTGFVKGKGSSTGQVQYFYEDKNLCSGKYEYRLKQIDYNGNHEFFYLENEVVINIPKKFELHQNYPNPFNPITKISFSLPDNANIRIDVFDVTGKLIRQIASGNFLAGFHEIEFDANGLASGIYFYRMISKFESSTEIIEKSMILLK
ncbi:MAG: hypothetical protein HGGPFJEG_01144 [Ignavibacteria bacterium]|nr:hypothetical protein [Ignavibacteria bacterium]